MRLMLIEASLDIKATEDEKYDFIINIAKGEIGIDKISFWIDKHCIKL